MKTEPQQTVTAEHRQRNALVYVRQAVTPHFVEQTDKVKHQDALRNRAIALGWAARHIVVIDADIGHGAAAAGGRKGFERVITEVATGRVGIFLSLGASRLARNLSDGQRLLDACARTDTLIGSAETPHKPQALRS
jgi:DNA invertase Pin-like site-specific DNA recombinase